jgi:hypothetical protein
MKSTHNLQRFALAAALAATVGLAGCGTPGAPMPPSLNLPDRVLDLAATRAGNQVALTWTMPRKNTDKLLLKGNVAARLCRQEASGPCAPAGSDLFLAPGANGAFTATLPAALTAGPPRPLRYFVELRNRNGRSAGLSNAALVVAGQAPAPVAGLAAEVRKAGVALRWTPEAGDASAVRLHRKLLTPPTAKPKAGLLTPAPEPIEQNLLVDSASHPGRALDKNIRFGQIYEYRAQRVARVVVEGKTVELAGEASAPLRVEVRDIFPPDTPANLAAVAALAQNGAETAIDLSWQPVADADLAGYVVYRREGDAAWQRISPAQPLVSPDYHDAHVEAGHSYRYAVSAIDQGGHESPRSVEARETVPNP